MRWTAIRRRSGAGFNFPLFPSASRSTRGVHQPLNPGHTRRDAAVRCRSRAPPMQDLTTAPSPGICSDHQLHAGQHGLPDAVLSSSISMWSGGSGRRRWQDRRGRNLTFIVWDCRRCSASAPPLCFARRRTEGSGPRRPPVQPVAGSVDGRRPGFPGGDDGAPRPLCPDARRRPETAAFAADYLLCFIPAMSLHSPWWRWARRSAAPATSSRVIVQRRRVVNMRLAPVSSSAVTGYRWGRRRGHLHARRGGRRHRLARKLLRGSTPYLHFRGPTGAPSSTSGGPC